MRILATAALLASLVCFAPGIASARVTGVATIGYEHTDFDYDHNSDYYYYDVDKSDGPSLSAAVAGSLYGDDSHWIVEGEGRLQSSNLKYNDDEEGGSYKENAGHAALHVAYRNDSWAVGAFYGMENFYGDDVQEVGIEAQKYFADATVQASAAYGKHDGSYCCDDYESWDVQVNADYYFNDNWSAGASVGYASWDYYSGNTEMTTVGVSGAYRIPNSNYSVKASYMYGDASDTYVDYKTNTFQIALVIDLGNGTAKERDQEGASLQGADVFDQHWRLWEPSYYAD
ncbi:MAG: hypothetical protein ABUS48_00150 [Pseudomonadota bacterium]